MGHYRDRAGGGVLPVERGPPGGTIAPNAMWQAVTQRGGLCVSRDRGRPRGYGKGGGGGGARHITALSPTCTARSGLRGHCPSGNHHRRCILPPCPGGLDLPADCQWTVRILTYAVHWHRPGEVPLGQCAGLSRPPGALMTCHRRCPHLHRVTNAPPPHLPHPHAPQYPTTGTPPPGSGLRGPGGECGTGACAKGPVQRECREEGAMRTPSPAPSTSPPPPQRRAGRGLWGTPVRWARGGQTSTYAQRTPPAPPQSHTSCEASPPSGVGGTSRGRSGHLCAEGPLFRCQAVPSLEAVHLLQCF